MKPGSGHKPFALGAYAMVAIGFAVGAPAGAQSETELGSRIARPKPAEAPVGNYTKDEQTRITFREFARCTYAKSPDRVAEVLMATPGSNEKALAALATKGGCLAYGDLTFNSVLFRGALFGEMYRDRQRFPNRPWTLPVPSLDFANVPDALMPEDVRVNYFLMDMSNCLFEKDPAAVKAVVLEPTASKDQKAAFDRVIAQLGSCVPKGLTMKFSRSIIESTLGEYLYRSLVPKIEPKEGTAR